MSRLAKTAIQDASELGDDDFLVRQGGRLTPVGDSSSSAKRCFPDTPRLSKRVESPFAQKAIAIADSMIIKKVKQEISLEKQEFQLEAKLGCEGCHSMALFFVEGQPSFYEGMANEDLVIKVFHERFLKEEGRAVLTEALPNILKQYKELNDAYAQQKESRIPYARIYNMETVEKDGYIVQEKVKTFADPLWNEHTEIEDLSEDNKSVLDQIKILFQYSFINDSIAGLDLKWANIGLRKGSNTLVVFDYFEQDDPFRLIANISITDIAQKNLAICNYILDGLEELCVGKASCLYSLDSIRKGTFSR